VIKNTDYIIFLYIVFFRGLSIYYNNGGGCQNKT